jgi:hypothetical protein
MTKIAEALSNAAKPMSQRQLLALVRGKDATKRTAFALLAAEGYISDNSPHTLLKPYASGGE